MNQWTRAGIDAYRAGNLQQARRFFKLAEMESPAELQAWMWSVELAETDAEKQRCLEQIVAIDPGQTAAWAALNVLKTRQRRGDLPHVSPFVTEDAEPEGRAPASEAVPSRPFSSNDATPVEATAPATVQSARSVQKILDWFKQPWWIWASFACAGLAVYAIISWLIAQFIR